MKTGRELDALVDVRVMGCCHAAAPLYSTDISAAWEVVENLMADGWNIHMDSVGFNNDIEGKWRTFFTYTDEEDLAHDAHVFADGDTAAHAICLAALKALEATP